MPDKAATRDLEIAEIAAKQHGVISSQQLRSSGLSRDTISRRNGAGRLHRVHRGVYAVGNAPRRARAAHGRPPSRSRTLTARETTRRMGIPVTTPARTLADLRQVVSQRELRRAIRQADALGLPLAPDAAHDGTRSDLERRFLGLCRRNRLPLPEVNAIVAGLEVDFRGASDAWSWKPTATAITVAAPPSRTTATETCASAPSVTRSSASPIGN